MTYEEKRKLLIDDKYPLSAKYNPEWLFENQKPRHEWRGMLFW